MVLSSCHYYSDFEVGIERLGDLWLASVLTQALWLECWRASQYLVQNNNFA